MGWENAGSGEMLSLPRHFGGEQGRGRLRARRTEDGLEQDAPATVLLRLSEAAGLGGEEPVGVVELEAGEAAGGAGEEDEAGEAGVAAGVTVAFGGLGPWAC